ncbi:uncharacterized protein [Hoplias malabaricus]|uniref:uncharacterized protein n=1 Tax=Hoplias malabaricus TaxID=27720 RepID=UPI00346222C3
MAKMESFNSFLIERFMSFAGEIFEVVKDTVSEYQEEMEQTKQENRRLKGLLSEIRLCADGDRQTTTTTINDAPPSPAEAAPVKQDSNRPPDSDPSVFQLKLELATVQQETDLQFQMKDASSSISSCAKSACDTLTSQRDGTQQSISHEAQDPEISLVKVKLELATINEEKGPQSQMSTEKHAHAQRATRNILGNALDIEGKKEQLDTEKQAPVLKPTQYILFNAVDTERKSGIAEHGKFTPIKSEPSEVQHSSTALIQIGNHLGPIEYDSGLWPSPNFNQVCEDLPNAAAHSPGHLTEKVFNCDQCGKPFRNSLVLRRHMVTCQLEKLYCCNLCGKNYSGSHKLSLHLRTHNPDRPFQCSYCRKRYKKKSHLKDHERIHTGDKRYSCSACGMCFIWTNQVKVHIQNHHRGQLASVIKK